MVRTPGELPGATVPPVLLTFTPIVPEPPRVPPETVIGLPGVSVPSTVVLPPATSNVELPKLWPAARLNVPLVIQFPFEPAPRRRFTVPAELLVRWIGIQRLPLPEVSSVPLLVS